MSITNRIKDLEERNSATEDSLEDIKSITKDIIKSKKSLTQNILKTWDTLKRPNLSMIGIEEGEETLLKGTENIFNIRIEENFSNIQKVMGLNLQESYRKPNRLNHREVSRTHNNQNTKFTESVENIKSIKGKRTK